MISKLKFLDKKTLGVIALILITAFSYAFAATLMRSELRLDQFFLILFVRIFLTFTVKKDYKLSWSLASTRSGIKKIMLGFVAFGLYSPVFMYKFTDDKFILNLLIMELIIYLFTQNSVMFGYKYLASKPKLKKSKSVVIYGAGKAGLKLLTEFSDTEYNIKFFVDDNRKLQQRTIDDVQIVSKNNLKKMLNIAGNKIDLLVIAMPSLEKNNVIKNLHEELSPFFGEVKVLPSLSDVLQDKNFLHQLRKINVKDLLARHPKDLDEKKIISFIKDKVVLVTGAGGSIGSEICRQCCHYEAKQVIMLDHSEFNLYTINEELGCFNVVPVLQTVVDLKHLEQTFVKYKPNIVIHAAAYKHVPMVEYNISEGIRNNVLGTKNCIDLSIKHKVKQFVLISTDKAVRPTNVMGTTKRIAELYAENSNHNPENLSNNGTTICAVRFGNVLGSSGSVIPKFAQQIESGGPITITDPEITRFFMLIPEACQLVLQAASLGRSSEILILDMGDPIKIVDLAKNMIKLSGHPDIKIEFTGLRPGEKLYEELLINETDKKTEFDSITIAHAHKYEISKLTQDIEELLANDDKLSKLKEIVPEFNHNSL
ncbi:MAG: nucleoside-diphosphate sugar epimerase/dehydratase [Candidatus Delongbacteria bacterium]|jgi:UDP-N-acetyl-D-glucosamine 4,6-dehydratase|nr:nucleoside-diphosphate sugar epimerase/dehydratase [Candidatus Delongbacteria bacterium]